MSAKRPSQRPVTTSYRRSTAALRLAGLGERAGRGRGATAARSAPARARARTRHAQSPSRPPAAGDRRAGAAPGGSAGRSSARLERRAQAAARAVAPLARKNSAASRKKPTLDCVGARARRDRRRGTAAAPRRLEALQPDGVARRRRACAIGCVRRRVGRRCRPSFVAAFRRCWARRVGFGDGRRRRPRRAASRGIAAAVLGLRRARRRSARRRRSAARLLHRADGDRAGAADVAIASWRRRSSFGEVAVPPGDARASKRCTTCASRARRSATRRLRRSSPAHPVVGRARKAGGGSISWRDVVVDALEDEQRGLARRQAEALAELADADLVGPRLAFERGQRQARPLHRRPGADAFWRASIRDDARRHRAGGVAAQAASARRSRAVMIAGDDEPARRPRAATGRRSSRAPSALTPRPTRCRATQQRRRRLLVRQRRRSMLRPPLASAKRRAAPPGRRSCGAADREHRHRNGEPPGRAVVGQAVAEPERLGRDAVVAHRARGCWRRRRPSSQARGAGRDQSPPRTLEAARRRQARVGDANQADARCRRRAAK